MSEEQIEVVFQRTGNSWIDAGIIGLFRVLEGLPSYVKSDVPRANKKIAGDMIPDAGVILKADRLIISGNESSIREVLDIAYQRLLDCYYNLSTEKQIAETKAYNFYFDSKTEKFIQFPKRKSWGTAALLFGKALSPQYKERQIPWEKDKRGKKVAGEIAVEDLVALQKAPEQKLKELTKFIKVIFSIS